LKRFIASYEWYSLNKYVLGEIIGDIKGSIKIELQLYKACCPILVPKEMGIS
jgi:hypothetical protein